MIPFTETSMRTILSLSLATVAAVPIGCGGATVTPSKPGSDGPAAKRDGKTGGGKAAKADEDHDHGEGPHGGTIIEFGRHHAEFNVSHPKKEVTVYVLGGDLKKAVAIPADKLTLSVKTPMFQIELKAVPMEGEPKGASSRFVAVHDNFGKEQEFEGTVSGEIGGKPYLGDFKEKSDGPDHKHDKK